MGRISSLAELVAVLMDGIAFYEQAAERVRDPLLVDFFLRMGYLKKIVAADLTAELARLGEAGHGADTLRVSLRQTYAELLVALSDATAGCFVEQLEQHEDRLLVVFRDASSDDSPTHVRDLAQAYLPMVDRMHGEMRRLKAGFGDGPAGG
ncbi:MAG: PA2169 family four-helix-bundle protein [Arenimonas sp.]